MKELIIEAWDKRELLKDGKYFDAVKTVIEALDKGRLRVASPPDPDNYRDGWIVNEWVKQAILMYFGIQPMQTWNIEPFEFYDKMLLKKNYKERGKNQKSVWDLNLRSEFLAFETEEKDRRK